MLPRSCLVVPLNATNSVPPPSRFDGGVGKSGAGRRRCFPRHNSYNYYSYCSNINSYNYYSYCGKINSYYYYYYSKNKHY